MVEERQARVVDISRYWRTGGINWPLLAENFDAVIMSAGVSFKMDVLLPEHTELAEEHNVPYATYHIPDSNMNMPEQAQFYSELSGVKGHKVFADVEIPYTGGDLPTAAEMLSYLMALDNFTNQFSCIYSRIEILKRLGFPAWLFERDLWIAQYIYENYEDRIQYFKFEPFLDRFGMKVPPSVVGTGLEENVQLWQFTEYGDARFYCANRLTADPINVYGMTRADLNVSMLSCENFLDWFILGESIPEPEGCNVLLAKLAALLAKVQDGQV